MSAERPDTEEVIRNILRLRSVERLADAQARAEAASAREFLEDLVGRTIRISKAARLLGISQPSLHRWIDKGEVSAVTTPEGRREVPLSELTELLEEVEQARDEGSSRPLGRVIRERHRAAEDIDLDRILPRHRPRDHRTAELHSLAYHRVVAERLDEHLVDQARRRLERWRRDDQIHPHWAEQWERVLAMPLKRLAKAISADTRRARDLRQTSPFAGVLTEQERRRIVQAIRDRA